MHDRRLLPQQVSEAELYYAEINFIVESRNSSRMFSSIDPTRGVRASVIIADRHVRPISCLLVNNSPSPR